MRLHTIAESQAAGHARRALELLELAADRARDAYGDLPARAKLTEAIAQMQGDTGVTAGPERELFQESARRSGRAFDPRRPIVPWALVRDLSMTSGAALVGQQAGDAAAALRGPSVLVRAGVPVIEGLVGDLALPRVTTGVTGEWLADDLSPMTPSQPSIGAVIGQPKTAAALTGLTHQIRLQAPQVEAIVRADLLAGVGRLVDAGALGGSGSDGEPLGLASLPGTGAVAGASMDWADTLDAITQAAEAGADDLRLAWVAPPAVREILTARERAAGSGFIWTDDTVAGRPAFVSNDCPSATAFVGDFGLAALLLWGSGFEFALDPFSGFTTGKLSARVMLHADFLVRHPAAFCKVTGVS
jgi:HK97 family phage major capsid protein